MTTPRSPKERRKPPQVQAATWGEDGNDAFTRPFDFSQSPMSDQDHRNRPSDDRTTIDAWETENAEKPDALLLVRTDD
jgi:hypothetical protein